MKKKLLALLRSWGLCYWPQQLQRLLLVAAGNSRGDESPPTLRREYRAS
jgi:hypothetical protein